MKLKLALAQIRCEKGDWQVNLDTITRCMEEASRHGCHIAVFPEGSMSGFVDARSFPGAVRALDAPEIASFVEATGKYNIAASVGFIEESGADKPFVTQVLAQNARITGVYRKVNIEGEELPVYTPGTEQPVFALALPQGELTCALAICADSDRPDLFKTFAEKGARIVFHSSAPGLYGTRTDEVGWRDGYDWYRGHLAERLPVWARDNSLFIAVATQAGATIDEDFPGGSYIFGP